MEREGGGGRAERESYREQEIRGGRGGGRSTRLGGDAPPNYFSTAGISRS
jgi:hypothetical protein